MSTVKNFVKLIGNLGSKPEVREFDSGVKKATVSIAISRTYINKEGVKKELTDWLNLAFWGKKAEFAEKYLSKGDKLAVVGTLRNENYTKTDGSKVYTTLVVVEEVEFLNRKKENAIVEETERATESANGSDDLPF